MYKDIKIILGKIRRQITADNDGSVQDQIHIFHGKCQMRQVFLPDLGECGILPCTEQGEKLFYRNVCRLFQCVDRAVGFQTATAAAVAYRTVRTDAHMLQDAAVHGSTLMDGVIGDHGSAQITV